MDGWINGCCLHCTRTPCFFCLRCSHRHESSTLQDQPPESLDETMNSRSTQLPGVHTRAQKSPLDGRTLGDQVSHPQVLKVLVLVQCCRGSPQDGAGSGVCSLASPLWAGLHDLSPVGVHQLCAERGQAPYLKFLFWARGCPMLLPSFYGAHSPQLCSHFLPSPFTYRNPENLQRCCCCCWPCCGQVSAPGGSV